MFTKQNLIFYFWAIYTAFLGGTTALSLISLASSNIEEIFSSILGLVGLIGLYGYVIKRNYLVKIFWKIIFLISVLYFIHTIVSFESARREYELELSMYGFFIFLIPQLYGLFQYADFNSKKT